MKAGEVKQWMSFRRAYLKLGSADRDYVRRVMAAYVARQAGNASAADVALIADAAERAGLGRAGKTRSILPGRGGSGREGRGAFAGRKFAANLNEFGGGGQGCRKTCRRVLQNWLQVGFTQVSDHFALFDVGAWIDLLG